MATFKTKNVHSTMIYFNIFIPVSFLIYILFLMAYSAFLGNIFYRESHGRIINVLVPTNRTHFVNVEIDRSKIHNNQIIFPGSTNVNDNDNNKETLGGSPFVDNKIPPRDPGDKLWTFDKCSSEPSFTCFLEISLFVLTSLLTLQEMLQLITLGPKRYFSEFENFVEIITLVLVYLCFILQHNAYVLKWLSAVGICLAYVELIFWLGKYFFSKFILWKSRCHILVTFPSHLKKLRSILRF